MNVKTLHYSNIFQKLLESTLYVTKSLSDRIHGCLDRLAESPEGDVTDVHMVNYMVAMNTLTRASARRGERLESYKAMIKLIETMLASHFLTSEPEIVVLNTMRDLIVAELTLNPQIGESNMPMSDHLINDQKGVQSDPKPKIQLTPFQAKARNLLASSLESNERVILFVGPNGSGRATVLATLAPVYDIRNAIDASDPGAYNMSIAGLNNRLSKISQDHARRTGQTCRVIVYGGEVIFTQEAAAGGRVVIPSNCQVIITLDNEHKMVPAVIKDDLKWFGLQAPVVELPRPSREDLLESLDCLRTAEILDQITKMGQLASFKTVERIDRMAKFSTLQEAAALVFAGTLNLYQLGGEAPRPSDITSHINNRVFAQDAAIKALGSVLKRNYAGMQPDGRMAGCFLFTGPTGTGKTETAVSLAKALCIPLLRLDLSEYAMPHTVHRLIGAPPSYIGYNDGAILVDFLKKNPNGVILVDEAEKGALEVTQLFLGMMDSGVFSTPRGDRIDCSNHWLIFTSNAGMKDVATSKAPVGFDRMAASDSFTQNSKLASDQGLSFAFAPEFLNRLDDVVFFNPLTSSVAKDVVGRFLSDMTSLILARRNIHLSVSPDVVTHIVKLSFNEKNGARALRRYCEQQVGGAVADLELGPGSRVLVDVVDGSITARQVEETSRAPFDLETKS